MAETYRVRVKPKQYNMITNLAEKKEITFAEATEKLIDGGNVVVGENVIDVENMDEKEIDQLIDDLEKEKNNIKSSSENDSSKSGLVIGSVVAGLIYLLSKGIGKD